MFGPFKQIWLVISFCRRERDHSEAERAQHIKQIHDLQEHIQEKERQLIELQEQVFTLSFFSCACNMLLKWKLRKQFSGAYARSIHV